MEHEEVARLVREALPAATVEVSTPRSPDDDDHFALTVVSPSFEGESILDRHDAVHDALEPHLTTDIHAIELETYTPAEYES
jgi:stress-induced morphogen